MKVDMNEKEFRWLLIFLIAVALLISGSLTVANSPDSKLDSVIRAITK